MTDQRPRWTFKGPGKICLEFPDCSHERHWVSEVNNKFYVRKEPLADKEKV